MLRVCGRRTEISHPTVGVVRFGSDVSERLSSSREEYIVVSSFFILEQRF